MCNGAAQLIDCGAFSPSGLFSTINAGVVCSKMHNLLVHYRKLCNVLSAIPDSSLLNTSTPGPATPPQTTATPSITDPATSTFEPDMPISDRTTTIADLTTPTPDHTTPTPDNVTSTSDLVTPTPDITTPTSDPATAGMGKNMLVVGTGGDCRNIGISLGVVLAITLLTLVGVVMGWVWSCHKKKIKQ